MDHLSQVMSASGKVDRDFLNYLKDQQLINPLERDKIVASIVDLELIEALMIHSKFTYQRILMIIAQFLKVSLLDIPIEELVLTAEYEADHYCKNEYLICKNKARTLIIVSSWDLSTIIRLRNHFEHPLLLTDKKTFFSIIEYHLKDYHRAAAINHLGRLDHKATAQNLNFIKLNLVIICLFIIIVTQLPRLFYLIVNSIYYLQSIFKLYLMLIGRYRFKPADNDIFPKNNGLLPVYTIIIPLYKDHNKVQDILNAVESLEYPKSRLDIKVVIEEDDLLTVKKLDSLNLPYYIHVIKVPYSLPRTKPKALNYAIRYCRGEYLVIYDAEDIPDKKQLLIALSAFYNTSLEYACMQAPLNFYNHDENYLTTFMSIEYGLWFDFFFRGLDSKDLPITLGGTSNHFRVSALKQVGMWDAFNVTEDADLGIRMYLHGYRTKIIDSMTLEEAPTSILNWLTQRSRWIKGFIQTFLVYYFQSNRLKKQLKPLQRATIWFLVGIPSYALILLPLLLVCIALIDNSKLKLLGIMNLLLIVPSIFVVNVMLIRESHRSDNLPLARILIALILWPFYLFLHVIASYKALYQILTKPFAWNRTKHGMSKVERKIR